jgi:hypothetical protein
MKRSRHIVGEGEEFDHREERDTEKNKARPKRRMEREREREHPPPTKQAPSQIQRVEQNKFNKK